jgi:hypothetical protein
VKIVKYNLPERFLIRIANTYLSIIGRQFYFEKHIVANLYLFCPRSDKM